MTAARTPVGPTVVPVPTVWRCGGRTCGAGECSHEEDEVHRHASSPGPDVAPPVVRAVVSEPGSPLSPGVRRDAEEALGHDFGQVRVHTDSRAAESARAVRAHAFTVGSDVVFGRGNYSPTTSAGRRLLFHELVHTTQRTGGSGSGRVARSPWHVSSPDDPAEVAAEHIAARASSATTSGPSGCPPGLCDEESNGVRLPQGAVLRQAVLGDAPPDLPCELSDATGHTPGTDVVFGHESPVLTPAARADIKAFVEGWKAGGSTDDVTVDGWASTDGAQALNWRLSCERAAVVRAVLDAQGVPTAKIKVVAHGESTEFSATDLPPNRRVVISRAPAATPPNPPTPGPGEAPAPPAAPPAAAETITSQTVLTSPGSRARKFVGVGEQVRLTHSPGSATWTKTDGTLSSTTGDAVTWTAPDTRKHAAIRADGAWIDFEVIAPTNVHMDRFGATGVKHTQNHADSGIEVQPFLLPDMVNFRNVQYRELNVGAVTNGVYACFPGTTGHCAQPAGGPCPPLTMLNTVVGGKGTQSTLADCVYSGDCLTAAPFAASSIVFDIPYEYRVGAGPFRQFRVVHQESNVAADGVTLTSLKQTARGVTTVAAASVVLANCP